MQLPDRRTHTPALQQPFGCSPTECARFCALDTKIKIHNIARHVAALPAAGIRRAWLADLEKKQPPAVVARVKRCVRWYFRGRADATVQVAA